MTRPASGRKAERRPRIVATAAFMAALAVRILLLMTLSDNYDSASWRTAVGILQRGGDIYTETNRYNYSPLWAVVLLGLSHVSGFLNLSLVRAVSLLLLIADLATALLLFRILRNRGATMARAWLGAGLFFLNPVSVLASSRRSAFDNLALLFLLAAVGCATSQPGRKWLSTLAMAASLLVKQVAWFHPLCWLPRKGRLRLVSSFLPYGVFLLSFAPFWRSWRGIRDHVFLYRGLSESYGVEWLRRTPWLPGWTMTALLIGAALLAVWFLRKVEFGRASLLLLLVVLVFLPGVVDYYFVWPIGLGALYPGLGYGVYTVITSLFLIHSPDTLNVEMTHLPGWSGPWWALVFWLLWEIRSFQRRHFRRTAPGSLSSQLDS